MGIWASSLELWVLGLIFHRSPLVSDCCRASRGGLRKQQLRTGGGCMHCCAAGLVLFAMFHVACSLQAGVLFGLQRRSVSVFARAARGAASIRADEEPEHEPTAVVKLVEGKSRLFKSGNPIIFSSAVQEGPSSLAAGDEVFVADHRGNIFARGFYNPHSMYRIRVTARKGEAAFSLSTEALVHSRLASAVQARQALLLPNPDTDAFRLVNGEGDQLSGLVVDVLGRHVIVQNSALWSELYASTIRRSLQSLLGVPDSQIRWKRSTKWLEQDGWTETDKSAVSPSNESCERGSIKELGIEYLLGEQKTGFYCDQRENRRLVRSLSRGKRVLDAYCYTGGFALNAMMGGATEVAAVDSSRVALDVAQQNAVANGFASAEPTPNDRLRFIAGDAVEVMRKMGDEGRQFDLVIVDPPKLAPTRHSLSNAIRKYTAINSAAMALVDRKGGLLLSCTCSGALTQQKGTFLSMLHDAAEQAGRRISMMQVTGAAQDHLVCPGFLESQYLTACLLYVH